MAVTRAPQRRRQRSTRVTVAVALLALATVAVVAALMLGTTTSLSVALIAVLALGWAGLRIMWTEILATRHEHATERADLARVATNLAARRAAQNDAFVAVMNERLGTAHQNLHEMAGVAAAAQQRAAQFEHQAAVERRRADANAQRADESNERVGQLERQIETLAAEANLRYTGLDDLMSFEDRVKKASTADTDAEIRRPA